MHKRLETVELLQGSVGNAAARQAAKKVFNHVVEETRSVHMQVGWLGTEEKKEMMIYLLLN